MTSMITGARGGGLSFRVLGIPVTIHVSFLLLIGLLGLDSRSVGHFLVWVGAATAGILVHELGHGVVSRLGGRTPRIDLAGLGGVTTSPSRGRASGRGWMLAITLAGPGAGLAAAGLAVGLGAPCCRPYVPIDLAEYAATTWVFVTLWWSLLNLLPVPPLDGGKALAALLPGTEVQRAVRAAWVGVVVGGGLVLLALTAKATFAAVLIGLLTWTNIQTLSRARQQASPGAQRFLQAEEARRRGDPATALSLAIDALHQPGPRPVRSAAASRVVAGLMEQGRHDEAFAVVTDARLDVDVDPLLAAQALARHGDRGVVRRHLDDRLAAGQQGARDLAFATYGLWGDFEQAQSLLVHGPVDGRVIAPVQVLALRTGAVAHAVTLGEVAAETGASSALVAYTTARAAARTGDVDAAVAHLGAALRLGWDDLEALRNEADLRPVHGHPQWPRLAAGRPPRGRA